MWNGKLGLFGRMGRWMNGDGGGGWSGGGGGGGDGGCGRLFRCGKGPLFWVGGLGWCVCVCNDWLFFWGGNDGYGFIQ